jgi:ABC-type multidrug transport system ATPase subunit
MIHLSKVMLTHLIQQHHVQPTTILTDSLIGDEQRRGISGGERRRLSIAVELLTQPPLLFLDECTTGLDSSSAMTVVKMVAAVAAQGTTVICRYISVNMTPD